MLELTPENAVDYLRSRGWLPAGPAQVELLGGGVSNAVLRVETPERSFVLKQSRPQLRTRDAWFSDLDRVYREQEVMQVLCPLLPPPTVPEVLFVDRDELRLRHEPCPAPEARVWKEALLAGEHRSRRRRAGGRVLGRMHEALPAIPAFRGALRRSTVFVQLRVDPFYARVQERRPEVADAVGAVIEQMLATSRRRSATATTRPRTS